MQKKWKVMETDEKAADRMAAEVGISHIVAGLLLHRGIKNADTAKEFLNPEKQAFHDPFLLRDMDKAVERICQAIAQREKIVVYGDYDVDGITSTALLMRNLSSLGADVEYYIPNRQTEGYGFNTKALQHLSDVGAALLISVDCGISAIQETAAMIGKLDIVITDHHLPQKDLPQALAVVDPHREDCNYPDKNLAGVGVAFKLCQALWKKMQDVDFTEDLEIVALGTIADVVPLLGENRHIVKLGLAQIQQTELIGLLALISAAGLEGKKISTEHIGFALAPRLNAAGRIGTAAKGAELLLAAERGKADALALELNEENVQRQLLEHAILELAEKQLQDVDMSKVHVLVLSGAGWHPGVIGIVASRIVEKYYRPTVVIGVQDGIGKGSCRSIEGFHMYDALKACEDLLLGFGGHAQAAGLSVTAENIDALREAMDAYAVKHLSPEDYIPTVIIEAELPVHSVDFAFIHEIELLEPFGAGNPRPLFCCRDVRGSYAKGMGAQGQHLRFQIEVPASRLTAIGWNMSEQAALVNQHPVDIAYSPEINEWNGRQYLQCKLQDIRPSSQRTQFPTREELGGIYLFLRHVQDTKRKITGHTDALVAECRRQQPDISFYTMNIGLEVFRELGLLQQMKDGDYIMSPPPREKLNLMASAVYRQGTQKKC